MLHVIQGNRLGFLNIVIEIIPQSRILMAPNRWCSSQDPPAKPRVSVGAVAAQEFEVGLEVLRSISVSRAPMIKYDSLGSV